MDLQIFTLTEVLQVTVMVPGMCCCKISAYSYITVTTVIMHRIFCRCNFVASDDTVEEELSHDCFMSKVTMSYP